MADCLAVDCGRPAPLPVPAPRSYEGVEWMAHDFDSLLRALLDRLPTLAPDWRDRSEADLGMVLLELFAYAGDQLSYLQDRVALEGFLRTATQHESVRKLLRLVDAGIDPGQAAQAWLLFEVQGAMPLWLPRGAAVSTVAAGNEEPVVFETATDAVLHPAASRIALAVDAPSSLDGLQLQCAANLAGVVGVGTRLLVQQSDTSDPHRDGQRAPAGEWVAVAAAAYGAVTTLTLAQPLRGSYLALGDPQAGTPPARVYGNAVPATHGQSQEARQAGSGGPRQALALEHAPVTQEPVAEGGTRIALEVFVDGEPWVEVDDFIDSEAADPHYRLARDNSGLVSVQFGDGVAGAAPAAGASIVVRYRAGNGLAGQVAPERLVVPGTGWTFPDASQRVRSVRNPDASYGAREPQSLAEARLLGPMRLREPHRAVVPADYEAALAQGVTVQGRRIVPLQTHARVRHTGAWNTVFVSVDLVDRRPLAATPGLREALEAVLDERRMAGGDVHVEDARYAALHLALDVDVQAEHFARDVRQAVERALVGPLAQGLPFFGPGRFRFGQPVYLSDLYAAVTAVEGVRSVSVARFKRLGDRYPDREAQGVIEVGALEVARCDNDPAATANGVLFLRTRGGKEG